MKIISGKFGGRTINIPKKLLIRPTTSICRHALFNILTNLISFDHIKVLDLFSGSGFFGYECASRGAKQIDFLEKDYLLDERSYGDSKFSFFKKKSGI